MKINDDFFEESRYDVFISYSRKDYTNNNGHVIEGNIISKIKDSLSKQNLSYWFDEEGIFSGEEFASIITQAIRNSKIFLFISSINSNKSKWTSNEIAVAVELRKIIIPFRLDNSPFNDSVMMRIASLDRIDCNDEQIAIKKLLRTIHHHLPNSSVEKKKNIFEITETSLDEEIKTSDCELVPLDKVDYRKLSICLMDKTTPIVVQIGPPCVGKTMTLVRLARYLSEHGYKVTPDRSFRSFDDDQYARLCYNFQELINGAQAASGTSCLDCLLVKIQNSNGESLVQFVDMAGELFSGFHLENVPLYMSQILNSSNPFIWIIMVEPYWMDMDYRMQYVDKIRKIKKRYFSQNDNVIIVVNKIDKTPFYDKKGQISMNGLYRHIQMEYPGLLDIFINNNPLTKIFHPYKCPIIPFMTGFYTNTNDGNDLLYTPSDREFPDKLWKELKKKL